MELRDISVQHIALLKGRSKPANNRDVLLFRAEGESMSKPIEVDEKLSAVVKTATTPLDDEAEAKAKAELAALGDKADVAMAAVRAIVRSGVDAGAVLSIVKAAGIELPKTEAAPLSVETPKPAPLGEPVVRADGSFDLSGVPENQRDLVSQLWRARSDAKQALAVAAKREQEMLRRDVADLVRAEMASVPGATGEQLVTLIMASRAALGDAAKTLEDVLRATSAATKESTLLQAHGRPLSMSKDSPNARMQQMVRAYADANKVSMSKAQLEVSKTAEYAKLYDEALRA